MEWEVPEGSVTAQRKMYVVGLTALLTESVMAMPVEFPSCVRLGTEARVKISPAALTSSMLLANSVEPSTMTVRRRIFGEVLDNPSSCPVYPYNSSLGKIRSWVFCNDGKRYHVI